jgi:hypothetical protein
VLPRRHQPQQSPTDFFVHGSAAGIECTLNPRLVGISDCRINRNTNTGFGWICFWRQGTIRTAHQIIARFQSRATLGIRWQLWFCR